MPSDGTTAFISYSREDSEFVLRMAQDLKAAGASVWMDQLDIQPGQRWARALQDAITNAPRFLVILSPHSVNSTNVEDEVQFALEERKMIIPVLFCDCKVPFQLRPFQYADFRTDYDRGMKILLHTLGVDPLVGSAAAAVIVTPEEPRPRTPSETELAHAAEQADLEEKKSEAAEQARRDEAAKLAAAEAVRLEAARIEAERVQREAAEQTRHEEEAKQAAAQARREEEARKAVEQARHEEDARQAAEQARLEELEKSAARAQQKEKERLAAEQTRQETEQAQAEKKRIQAVEQARREEEARQAAEQARLEEKRAAERAAAKKKLQDVADQAQREAEAKQAAEQARLEEKKLAAARAAAEKKRKDAAEQTRREKEAKQAVAQREVDQAALAAKRADEEAAKNVRSESKPASGWREDLGMKIAAGAVMLVVAVGAVWLSGWVDNKTRTLLHPAAKPSAKVKPVTPAEDSSANQVPAAGVSSSQTPAAGVDSTPAVTVPGAVVTKKPLLPNGETGREALLGQHRLSLQWISWEKFGTATVTNNDGVLVLKGSQHVGDEYLTVEGTVTSVFPRKFTMHGVIVTKIDSINKGQPCKRTGDMTFAITGNRQYWRLQQMDNPCEAVTDYVDIYLR